MLKFYLVKNKLKSSVNAPYLPKTIRAGHIDFEELVSLLASNSTVKKADAIAVLDNLSSILQTQLANGYSIDLGFCLLRPELKGNFSSYEEKFSRKKHRIDVSFFPGKKIIKSLKMATARKTTNLSPTPIISHLRPVLDRGKNVFHRGDMISIVGKDLKFTETETEGVFLLPNRSKQETRVAEYFCIKPSEVGIKIPDLLSPGTYVLVLRVFFGDTLKEEKYSEPIQIN